MTDGIALLFKPAGLTSFQTLGFVKRALRTTKVGHAGTLDRFAEGLLMALTGALTRLCPYASSMDKEYEALMRFGTGTDTLDLEGTVDSQGPVPAHDELVRALPGFIGAQEQVPPAYSALHVGGKRAYQAARNGEKVELAPRTVTIREIELLSYRPPDALVRVSCSKGTYIRALARDIAVRLGTCAHLIGLKRTRIGGFLASDAVRPDGFKASADLLPPEVFFKSTSDLMRVSVSADLIPQIANGIMPRLSEFDTPPEKDGIYGIFTPDGRLLALVERTGKSLKFAAVLVGGTRR